MLIAMFDEDTDNTEQQQGKIISNSRWQWEGSWKGQTQKRVQYKYRASGAGDK